MDLIVNGTALRRTSLGGRRYCHGVLEALAWDTPVETSPPPRWPRLERIDELLSRGRSDAVFWSPNQRGPLFARNHVVTVLDCINVEYTYAGDWRLPLLRRMFDAVLGNAVAVVAISHATRSAILRNYSVDPAKVLVFPGPVDFRPTAPKVTAIERPSPNSTPFVLMVTNALPHKNTARAAQAFAASDAARRGVVLRVVGAIDPVGLATCRAAGINVECFRGVDDDRLARWFAECEFLLSPSLDEGLNLPIAETLAHGGNVLCSDIPVHREFYDRQAAFFDPRDVDAMTGALNHALGRERPWVPLRAVSAGPSFDDVASQYRALFLRLAAGERPQP